MKIRGTSSSILPFGTMSLKQSDSFKQNRLYWQMFGLWPGRTPNKHHKYVTFIFLMITLIAYNGLLFLNLYYTPRKINFIIREVIFIFTEIAVISKVFMILIKRTKLVAVFNLLDCEDFQGHDNTGRKIVKQYNSYVEIYRKTFATVAYFTYLSLILLPVIGLLFYVKSLDLPVCQYYFLSDETRNDYFVYIYIYQSIGLYSHLIYNISIDSLIVGLLVLAIAQVTVLEHDLRNLKIENGESTQNEGLEKLHKCIKHYTLVLRYCREFHDVIDTTIFVQFGVGSGVICVTMCGLLLSLTVEAVMFLMGYFFALNMQIFVPAWLGTQLKYKSEELMRAVYKSDWIPRSKGYKKTVLLFVERAKIPIVISGLNMFPLTLSTYISIMKTAYSCFTLVRSIQDRQER